MTNHPHPHYPNPYGEATCATAVRLSEQFHRLAAGLHEGGFEALRIDAETPEESVVDSCLSIIRQLSELAGLIPGRGWMIEAQRLRHGMVIDYSPFVTLEGREPSWLTVQQVGPAGEEVLVVITDQDGFVSCPLAADFPFEVQTAERMQLERAVVAAEQSRVGLGEQACR